MSESEAAASAALMFAAAVMAVAWMADNAGLPIHPTIVLVLALASLALISLRRSRTVRDVSLARFAAFVVLVAGFTG